MSWIPAGQKLQTGKADVDAFSRLWLADAGQPVVDLASLHSDPLQITAVSRETLSSSPVARMLHRPAWRVPLMPCLLNDSNNKPQAHRIVLSPGHCRVRHMSTIMLSALYTETSLRHGWSSWTSVHKSSRYKAAISPISGEAIDKPGLLLRQGDAGSVHQSDIAHGFS